MRITISANQGTVQPNRFIKLRADRLLLPAAPGVHTALPDAIE
jgi:hypothetical protein